MGDTLLSILTETSGKYTSEEINKFCIFEIEICFKCFLVIFHSEGFNFENSKIYNLFFVPFMFTGGYTAKETNLLTTCLVELFNQVKEDSPMCQWFEFYINLKIILDKM